jgi:hypothetical protein
MAMARHRSIQDMPQQIPSHQAAHGESHDDFDEPRNQPECRPGDRQESKHTCQFIGVEGEAARISQDIEELARNPAWYQGRGIHGHPEKGMCRTNPGGKARHLP